MIYYIKTAVNTNIKHFIWFIYHLKMSLKNFSEGSISPFGGLYTTLIKVFFFLFFFLKVILHHCYIYSGLVEA